MDENTMLATFHLDETNGLPLYEQLIQYFRMMIRSGVLKPGEQVIPETSICALYSISRSTVRQAMNQLADEGLISRRRGKGSFVADEKMKRPVNYLYNFTENMESLGKTPSSVILQAEVVQADSETEALLRLLGESKFVFHLLRLRCADGKPILLEETNLPYYLCKGIEAIDFTQESLYRVLADRYNLNIARATETIEAIIIRGDVAKQLACKNVTPGYRITRVSFLDSGFPIEYTRSITNAEACMFQLELSRSKTQSMVSFQRKVTL